MKAEEYFRRSLDIREKLVPGSLYVAESFNNLGSVANQRGNFAKAEEYIRYGLDIRERLAPRSPDVVASLNSLGNVAFHRGELAKAEKYLQRALTIENELAPESLEVAFTMQGLGNVAHKWGDSEKAQQYYRRALAIREKLAPGSKEHAESLAAVAAVLQDQQQLNAAAQYYEQATNALESQIARLGGSEEERSGFRAAYQNYYKEYIDLLTSQNHPELALQVSERSRARILVEMLESAHVDIHKGADPILLERERSLQESIKAKTNRRVQMIGDRNSKKQVAILTEEIEELEEQYQEVEAQLRLNSPAYAALTQPSPLTADEIQKLLDPDTLLIEYSLGEEHSYVFAVTGESLAVHELPKRADIESRAKHLYKLLTARNHFIKDETAEARHRRIAQSAAEYSRAAAVLSRILLGPLAADLGNKRLVIVGDGALQYVPFSALPIPQKTTVPLIAEHEIVELPSASVLAVLRGEQTSRQQPSKQVVILADPVFDAQDVRVKHMASENKPGPVTRDAVVEDAIGEDSARQLTRSLADVDLNRNGTLRLPRLAFTRREADNIAALAPAGMGREAVDFDANRGLAVNGELTKYHIVHFATHALVDNQHPELSGLVLSLVDEKGNPQNGFLNLQDIYNLDLAADLVVLSACDTALGKQIDGEGMIGLTRGFMYAGASRVVSSLWSVDDVATAELMKRFYRAMEKDGMRPAAALRQAQIAMWKQKDWHSPYYWAAFQLQGEWK